MPPNERRTYVLVHGAWHGGWCWRRVADVLTGRGHAVFTPTQTGLGERRHLLSEHVGVQTFVDDVVQVIEAEELQAVILVGHSFGGRIVCGVADRMPERLAHLVLLDANVPENGKAALDAHPPEVRAARLKAAEESSGGLTMPPPGAAAFGISDPEQAAWLERRLTPHPLRTYTEPLHFAHALGNGVATTYVRCTAPAYGPADRGAAYAKTRRDWRYLELATGHDAMVSAPGPLAELLLHLP